MTSRRIRFWLLLAAAVVVWQTAFVKKVTAQQVPGYAQSPSTTRGDIVPGQLVIRFMENNTPASGRTLGTSPGLSPYSLGEHFAVSEVRPLDPALRSSSSARQLPSKHLSGLYFVRLDSGDVLETIGKLSKYSSVLYAEPVFREQLFLVPNDPDAATANGKQSYLSSINAYDAWGITTGDSTVVIGVIDTGAQYDHEDLGANVLLNTADPIDGVDNDGNGYVDDYRGWDFANNDNDPMADSNPHGTHVSGIAAARTSNAKGIAGVGYRSKFIPLKAFKSEDNTSLGTYEAIIYAANRGVDVLNLSWGSTGSYNQAAQDIINYAVLEKDVVIVAAAGNTNEELTFYPASYDNVLSVAASTNDGTKAGFATYGYYVDLVAPGNDVYSTRNGNTYGTSAGSSFSAPQVAGAAALLRSYFPKKNAIEIMEMLRTTANSVDDLAGNSAFKGLLGRGKLNMFKALTDTLSPAVRIVKDSLFTQTGQTVYHGDTAHFELEAVNWLKPANALSITFESLSQHASVVNGSWTAPVLAKFDTTSHSLHLLLNENTPPSSRVIVKAKMAATNYSDFQYFEFTTQPDSISTFSSHLSLTINSRGDLGFTKDSLKAGKGFRFQNTPLLSHAGFLVGNGAASLADNAANNLVNGTKNKDFTVAKHLKKYAGTIADNYYENSFQAPINAQQTVLVEQKTLGWLAPADSNLLITEYRLTNTSADTIANLHAGLFTNWDIVQKGANRTVWVDSLKLGLSYIDQNGYYAGIALLTAQQPTFYAADIDNLNGNTADITSLLTDSVKFAWLSSHLIKTSAGQAGAGNNTAQMNGVNLGKLPGYRSSKVAFVWVASETTQGVVSAVQRARNRYAAFQKKPRNIATVFACNNQPATLSLTGGQKFKFYGDPAGAGTPLFTGNAYVTDTITSNTTLYARNADHLYDGEVFGIEIKMDGIHAQFEASQDTVLLEGGLQPLITLQGTSDRAVAWAWDFGNGFQSTLEKPQARFFAAGNYTVTLTTTSPGGCKATSAKTILVANRAPVPLLDTLRICRNAPAVIQAPNASNIRVYADSTATAALFEGSVFTSAAISKDTLFYVTNADSIFESKRVPVVVKQNQPVAAFGYMADTTTFSRSIQLLNQSEGAVSYRWYADGILVSQEAAPKLPATGSQLTIKLEAVNAQGCMQSVTTLFSFEKSATPVAEDVFVCPGDTLLLRPANGTIFQFYDGTSAGPTHKGRSFELTNVRDTTVLLVTSVDKVVESDPVQVVVIPYAISAEFVIDPEILILKKQKTAQFTALSDGASSWQWHLNDELVDITRHPVLAFDSAGAYKIKLVVGNEQGCVDSLTRDYQILEVTGLEPASDYFELFPNPASKSVTVALRHSLDGPLTISLFNMAGQELLSKTLDHPLPGEQVPIALSHLPPGIYSVRLSSRHQTWQQRLLKR